MVEQRVFLYYYPLAVWPLPHHETATLVFHPGPSTFVHIPCLSAAYLPDSQQRKWNEPPCSKFSMVSRLNKKSHLRFSTRHSKTARIDHSLNSANTSYLLVPRPKFPCSASPLSFEIPNWSQALHLLLSMTGTLCLIQSAPCQVCLLLLLPSPYSSVGIREALCNQPS